MERGFDKLMTPEGLNLVVGAMFLFFLIIVAGGVIWRMMERASRAKRDDT
jgi:hypothetical protein